MKIVQFSVKNFQFTIVIFLLLIALGINSLINIPRSEDPDFPISYFPVVAIFPGASPIDMEQLVADKIEEKLNELDDIKNIYTYINDGVCVVAVEFEADSNPEKKHEEVLRQVNSVRPELPSELYSLETIKASSTDANIIQNAFVSETASYHELQEAAKNLKDELSGIKAIKKVKIEASPERELRISVDIAKLSVYKVSLNQIMGAVQSDNSNIPGGSIEIGSRKFNIKTSGNYKNLEELESTIINAANGKVVYLKDVAAVNWSNEDIRYFGRYNGKRAVFITANMKEGQNIFNVRDEITEIINNYSEQLPENIKLVKGFDQAENVKSKLGRLQFDFIFAVLLVLLTLIPLGLRASGVVMVSIPLSVLIGLSALYFTGFSINQLSIVGFVIALGLLVDDSIVVVENISRWIREGSTPYDAAIKATGQIGMAVVGCTMTLILAFLPLLFLPGLPGLYIKVLPVTIIYTVLASLLVSLTIVPFLSSKVFKSNAEPEGNKILQALNSLIEKSYGKLLSWALANPYKTILIALMFFIATLSLLPVVGFSLFPKAGMPQFLITVETPQGSSLNETDKAVRYVEKIVSEKSEIKYYMSNIGKGNPQIYYNSQQKNEQPNLGEILCEAERMSQPDMTAFLDELRNKLSNYPNARIMVQEFENGPDLDAPIALRIIGDNLDTLKRVSSDIEKIMKQTDGTMYVKNPLSESVSDIRIKVNSEKAGILGVPMVEIDRTIRLALAGIVIGKFREADGKEYSINIRLPKEKQHNIETLEKIYISSLSGAQIPLSQLAGFEFEQTQSLIQHYNTKRSITVTSFVKTGFNTDKVTKEILDEIETVKLPANYRIIPAGEIESRSESFGGIGSAVLIALFGIIAVLILEFKTVKSTLIVASVIPLGIVGGILMLLITGYTLSFAAAIGFVALVGIEIKTSILLVDFTNQLRREGTELNEAILKAGEVRFLPVILTSLTAIGGLLPVALSSSSLYSPLAWVIIGGLISSTLLARLVTPVMYKIIPPKI